MPTMRPHCCARSTSRRRMSWASRWAARSRSIWRCAIPSSCAACPRAARGGVGHLLPHDGGHVALDGRQDAPDERSFYDAFFLWVYTPRELTTTAPVDQIIAEAMAFPHQAARPRRCSARSTRFTRRTTLMDRLGEISVPTLVIASTYDLVDPPRQGRAVADDDSGCAVRAPSRGRGAPAVPGGAGRVQRDGRCLLARVGPY